MSEIKREDWRYKAENAEECPFCGSGSISVIHKEMRFLGGNFYGVKKHKMQAYCMCNMCHAKGKPVIYIGYSNRVGMDAEHLPVYSCGDKAIKAWNTRKPMERIVEKLEERYTAFICKNTEPCDYPERLGCCYDRAINDAIEIVKAGGVDATD